eukprot:4030213-Pyramimonas_sp.AAC.1
MVRRGFDPIGPGPPRTPTSRPSSAGGSAVARAGSEVARLPSVIEESHDGDEEPPTRQDTPEVEESPESATAAASPPAPPSASPLPSPPPV